MKTNHLFITGILMMINFLPLSDTAQAQVIARPAPKKGFEKRIHDAVFDIRLINTHEHLQSEEAALNKPADFNVFFKTYQTADMVSAGMNVSEPRWMVSQVELEKKDLSVEDKWNYIKDFWKETSTTAYGRLVLITMRDLYGINDLSENTLNDLSAAIKKVQKKDYYYNYVLKEKAKIDVSIQIAGPGTKDDTRFFRHVFLINPMFHFAKYDDFSNFMKDTNVSEGTTLADMEKAIENAFKTGVGNGGIGTKLSWAYSRTIQADNVQREKAEEIFNTLKKEPGKYFPDNEVKPLQDYFLYKALSQCEKYDLPVQIHTGLLTFNGSYLNYSDPLLLTNTIMSFPKVKFVLLHSGYPWGGETAALAKMFKNVYIDMVWTPIISPSYATRYLQEFIETVPQNKIMAFGGDAQGVEGTYGASVIAREVAEQTLVSMVRSRYLSEEEAIILARKLLRENAIKLYKLDFLK